MGEPDIRIEARPSAQEVSAREQMQRLFIDCPIPLGELMSNLGLFIRRQDLSRLLFISDLYRRIVDVHGSILEFGVRWGQNLALFTSLRGIFEPFNHNRKIVGFDTWEGFPSVHAKDGHADVVSVGAYATTAGYENYLEQLLACHEQESPIAHIRKFELVKGDATVEVDRYLERNPETIVALAFFDLDLYEPTRKCLEAIRDRLTRGSVVAFDQVNVHAFPGETLALKEVFGLDRYRLYRSPYSNAACYLVVE
ncbi:MAG TPA: TylF/MycF/NovP-related O-methyltransferase [Phycisphaerae bacterium]|nr:TylF/MycF/NovP-related O-methyltransferase [Phycisphaerae bacterium]HOJ73069.1 TylF/MycF/NovP-related O-methyltransferase [Phycisphaerae bacterium]HOM52685.1 TylF/MycF/NovP-related O-methyltransferase [Phycisphaerae bacterium]HON66035.1 TylF/MycF/NovP-related O-methyltransferase [Phycisphaerae bacterium]HOQ85060.1 TylF/MycF/NovP-related O-methyltransferase [Phycisphaerae bacterium]